MSSWRSWQKGVNNVMHGDEYNGDYYLTPSCANLNDKQFDNKLSAETRCTT